MRLQHELILSQARYLGGRAVPTKDDPKVTLAFRTALTRDVAEAFGCRELVYAGDVPRSGVASMALEGGEMDCEIHLKHDNLAFSATVNEMGHYVAKFEGTGPALVFQLKLTGHAHLVADLTTQVKIDPLEITLRPAQMNLNLQDGEEAEAEADGEDDSERLISKEQAADTSEAADEPGDVAPLASVVQMGGSHQKGGRGRRRRGGEPEPVEAEVEPVSAEEPDILEEMGVGGQIQ